MKQSRNCVALDCGNSSFRIVLGRYENGKITREVIDQYANDMIRAGALYYWDLLRILEGFKASLSKAAKMAGRIDSVDDKRINLALDLVVHPLIRIRNGISRIAYVIFEAIFF